MDHRYGAWAQLLTLFRLIYDGGRHGGLKLLPRKGYLFDPDRYPFLEGRAKGSRRQQGERTEPPRVSDGIVFRVLQNLLILDGERLSYRTLDVEQIGSVYETIMGFNLEVAQGRSIAVKPTKPHGAPTTINLEELLAAKPADRAKWLKEKSDQAVTGQAATALKDSQSPEDAVAALEKKVAREATPNIVPRGAMVLQPSEERRRSGSHYTPRVLTEPIVETTFRPILERLGPNPTPEQILDLKVCDPAMGSGAFLVAVCRFLAELLVKAWHAHDSVPSIPPDEDEILHARRIVAQRCLYGVDKNPMAVDLAKLSLWLATLAKDHPFTFLDHALRHGDSLVGLSKKQIEAFHWKPERQRDFARNIIEDRISRATTYRREIREAAEATPEALLSQKLALADEALNPLRFYGDLVIAAFFSSANDRQRKARLDELAEQLKSYLTNAHKLELRKPLDEARRALLEAEKPIHPFHWEIEFPEVFDRENPGFDAFVGNPPFLWGNRISRLLGDSYRDWLLAIHPESHGNSDIVAHFFRSAFDLLGNHGCFGLLATNSISESDTRQTGLDLILKFGGIIFHAVRDFKWIGSANVRVALVCVSKQPNNITIELDGEPVESIGSDLRIGALSRKPDPLESNSRLSFKGVDFGGTGFLLSLRERDALLASYPNEESVIWPVMNAENLTSSPTFAPERSIINFTNLSLEKAEQWIGCMTRVREFVLPHRQRQKRDANRNNWWIYNEARPGLYAAISGLSRVLVNPVVSKYISFAYLPPRTIFTNVLNVFAFDQCPPFTVLQSRIHEVWALRTASTLRTDPRYNPSDCFETFPFPEKFETNPTLEATGQAYYEFRAALMVRNNEGLTKTYNRFHDPDERSTDMLKLRELHAAMDRAVLDAYGWNDLKPTCEFLLDYEEDEDEDETGGGRRRKKPWRYRWPDEFRDEVLARLLELNRQRAEEERLSGAAAEAKSKKPKKTAKKAIDTGQQDLF
jgi:N-6 DNA Methylase